MAEIPRRPVQEPMLAQVAGPNHRRSLRDWVLQRQAIAASVGVVAALFAFLMADVARPESGSWTGATSNVWQNNANWTGSTFPTGRSQFAVFNGSGNGQTTLDVGTGANVDGIVFDSTSVASYTIGTGSVGSQTIALSSNGFRRLVAVNSNVTQNQLFNANLLIGHAAAATTPIMQSSTAATLTFAGAVQGGGTSGANTLTIYGPGSTIFDGVIANNAGSGAATLALTSGGQVTLKKNNTYTGATTIVGGTLTLQRATGSLNQTTVVPLTFGGTGTFNLDNVGGSGALAQGLGALTFTAGDGTVKTTRTADFDESLTFASLAARGAGATGNFVNGGGVNGTANGFVLTGVAAGFIDKNVFYGGSAYAAMNALGTYVRALDYGSDTNTAATDTITASRHVKLTASPTSQNSISLLTLNLAGGGVNWAQNASQILTVPGILKSGGGAASTISGGSAVTGGNGIELVIRTDSANDELVINTPITGSAGAAAGTGALTKSGLGKLTLGAVNTYTGFTYVNAGTLAVGADNAIASGGVTINGGRLDLGTFSDTVGAVTLTAGSITGTGTLTATSYAMNGNENTAASAVLGGAAATLTKSGLGTLAMSAANTYAGKTEIQNGILEVTSLKNGGVASGVGASTNVATNLAFNGGAYLGQLLGPTLRYVGPGDSTDRLFQIGGYTGATLDASGTGAIKFTNTGSVSVLGPNYPAWLELTGTNSDDNTFSPLFPVANTGTALLKTGSGRWILTNANTYAGTTDVFVPYNAATTIKGGLLGATLLADGGVASSIGRADNTAVRLVIDGGSLQYLGTGSTTGTTNRLFTLGVGATAGGLDASGASGSPMVFTNVGSIAFTGTGARTLTLSGINTDENRLSAIIGNQSTNPTSLSKTGSGLWRLSGTNTYTGTTTVSGGVLRANPGVGLPTNSPLVLSGGVLESSANVARAVGTAAGNMRMPGGTSGFSARGGAIQVAFGTLGSPAFLAWGDVDFNPAVLVLNAGTADSSLEFLNMVDLGSQNRTVRVDAATARMSGMLSGTGGGLIKQGPGTLILTASNQYTGPTTVSGGVLSFRTRSSLYNADESQWTTTNLVVESGTTAAFGAGGASGFSTSQIETLRGLATASGGFKNGSSLGFDTTGGNFSWDTVLDDPNGGANAVGLTKLGANTLTLNAANTYTGPTRVLEGTLAYGINNAVPGGAVEVAGGTLDLATFSGSVGAVTVSGGSLSGSGLLTSTSGFTFSNAAATTAAARLGGAVGLVKTGAGTTTLSGASTFTGGVAIQGGSLSVASLNYVTAGSWTDRAASNLGSPADQTAGTIAIGSGGTAGGLVYTGTGETTDRVIDLAGTTGGATIDQSGSGTLEFTSALAVSGAGAKTLTLQGSGTGRFTGLIGNGVGNVGVVKGGTGTWTLTGLNAYSGSTQVNQGTLVAGSADALGTSALTVAGGTLNVGAFAVSLPSVSLTSGGITASTGSLTSLMQFAMNVTGTSEVSAVLDGSAGLAKSGPGTLTLSKPNVYVGTTSITAGTLAYGVNNAIGQSAVVVNGGTLDMKTFSGTVLGLTLTAGSLTGTGTLTSGSTIVANNAAALTASAPLAGSVGLTKSDAGTLTLTGLNTYSGPTILEGSVSVASLNYVTSGTWSNPAASNLGAPRTVADGTIKLGHASNNSYLTYTGPGETTDRVIDLVGLGVTPQVQNTGTGPLVFTSNVAASVTGNRTLILRPGTAGSITFSGTIGNSPAGGVTGIQLTSTAPSAAVLSGANTYTGTTRLQGGVLRADDGVGLPTNSYLQIDHSATTALETGVNFTRATGTGAGQVSLNNTAGFSAFGNDIVVALGGLVNTPTVTWGSNSFTPSTFVLNAATATHAIDFKNAVSLVNTARAIEVNANTATLSGVISSTGTTGGFTKSGAGVLVLSAANTYTGQTQVTGGVLRAATTGTGLPAASRLTLNGGVFETGANFERTGGTAAGNIDITGGVSGFSAFGADIQVAFGTVASPDALTWGTAPFVPGTLVLNAATATHAIDFKNAIALGASARSFQVNARTATLSGILSGASGGVTKTGGGTLVLAGSNSYTGQTLVSAGVLRATNGVGLPTGSRLTLNGGVIETGGNFERAGGTAAGNMDITGSLRSGFSARGSALQVAFGTLASPTALTWGTAPFAPGTLVLNEATADNPLTFANAINLNAAVRTVEVGANTATIAGALTGTGASGLTKTGAGRLVLSAVNTYAGATSVDQGTLEIGSLGTINGTSGITIGAAGRLRYDSATALSRPTTVAGGGLFYNSAQNFSGSLTFTSGTLGGTNLKGNLGGLTIGADRILSPGNSPGTAATTSQTWAGGGTYLFEVNSADGIPGSGLGWDLLTGTGTLDITASSASPFTIKLASLTLQNASGPVDDFNPSGTYAWLMADFASPITSFDPSKFTIDTSLFTNSYDKQFQLARGDTGSIGGADTQLYVLYGVPEPGLAGVVLAGLAVAGLVRASRISRQRSAGRPARP